MFTGKQNKKIQFNYVVSKRLCYGCENKMQRKTLKKWSNMILINLFLTICLFWWRESNVYGTFGIQSRAHMASKINKYVCLYDEENNIQMLVSSARISGLDLTDQDEFQSLLHGGDLNRRPSASIITIKAVVIHKRYCLLLPLHECIFNR